MSTHWLTNPINNPMTMPLAMLMLAVFVGAGLALLGLHIQRAVLLNQGAMLPITLTAEKVLWRRYRTWVNIAIFFIGATLTGPLAVTALCAFLCWQGGQEYGLLTHLPAGHRWLLI